MTGMHPDLLRALFGMLRDDVPGIGDDVVPVAPPPDDSALMPYGEEAGDDAGP